MPGNIVRSEKPGGIAEHEPEALKKGLRECGPLRVPGAERASGPEGSD